MPSVQCPQPCPELRPGSCSDCHALPRPHVHGRFLGACPLLAEVYRGDGALIRPVKCLPLEGRQAGRVPEDSGNSGVKFSDARSTGTGRPQLPLLARLTTSHGSGGSRQLCPKRHLQSSGDSPGTLACAPWPLHWFTDVPADCPWHTEGIFCHSDPVLAQTPE